MDEKREFHFGCQLLPVIRELSVWLAFCLFKPRHAKAFHASSEFGKSSDKLKRKLYSNTNVLDNSQYQSLHKPD